MVGLGRQSRYVHTEQNGLRGYTKSDIEYERDVRRLLERAVQVTQGEHHAYTTFVEPILTLVPVPFHVQTTLRMNICQPIQHPRFA